MVSVITCTIREEYIENVFKNYEQQLWKDKELIIILNKDTMNLSKWKKKAEDYHNVSVFQLHEQATLGDCLNFGVEKSKYDYIAKFDDDDYYGPYYLAHAMPEFNNKDIAILGKSSYYVYFNNKKALMLVSNTEKAFTDSVAGATLIFKKDVFKKIQFEKVNRAEDYFFIDTCKRNGFKVYSTDRHNFAVIRHDTNKHTWKVSDEDYMQWGEIIAYTDDFQSFVERSKFPYK
ncbi:glycosyltransferase [Bacillus sp. WLY-B-L8]|uniref:glycosyltransferase n=1 Tax=Bacillus multifaciens TaxID=3068506 RepID=UPI0027409B05|nr:glycosyltransferase family 2 protein [Bacillus sp. WLY-B-L8]MDP7981290.1 glycosyltransferase family 2 protein [Bacillus sp. WLY-B-L8]